MRWNPISSLYTFVYRDEEKDILNFAASSSLRKFCLPMNA